MNEFIENLKREASANPTMTVGVVAGLVAASSQLIAAAAKMIDASAHHKGANGYLKYAKVAENKAKAGHQMK